MVILMAINDTDAKKVWEAYKMYTETAYVIRTGFQYFGMTQDYSAGWLKSVSDKFFERGQSAAEHQANVALLCNLFSSNFPCFFDQQSLTAQDSQSIWVISMVALLHDVSEVKIGDIPDDGSPEHAAKEEGETQIFNRFAELGFIDKDADALKDGFKAFQKKNQYVFNATYVLDKLEAVFTLIFLEKHECIGNMKAYKKPTKLDRELMRVTGTTNPVDCLALHFKMICEHYRFSESITEPVYAVLKAAIIDARGEFFNWWEKESPSLGNFISSPH